MDMEEENQQYDAFENLFKGKIRFVNLAFVAINVFVFVILELFANEDLYMRVYDKGAAVTPLIIKGEYYRLFTSMILHAGIGHLFGNMLMILFVGDELEEITGHIKYFIIAILGGLIGNFATIWSDIANNVEVPSVGASGVAYAILGGFMICILKKRLKRSLSIRMIIFVTMINLSSDFNSIQINATAHLGGLIGGLVLGLILIK